MLLTFYFVATNAFWKLYERSLVIESFKTLSESVDIDINAPVGTTYNLGSSTVTMIDPYTEYVSILKECFDFDALRAFLSSQPKFSMLFDGMHGAGGPFAKRVLVDELGLPEVCCLFFTTLCYAFSNSQFFI